MDANKKLRSLMTKRSSKTDNADVCLDSTQKLAGASRRPLPYPRNGAPVNVTRHRPRPQPRNVSV